MAFMGCGDLFYGERDYRPDGSYVTTRWLCVLYVPLVPLETLRVREIGAAQTKYHGPIISTSQNYEIYSAGAPHRLQVFSVYLFVVCFAAWMWGLLWSAITVLHLSRLSKGWDVLAFLVVVLVGVASGFSVPLGIRRRALKLCMRDPGNRSDAGAGQSF